MSVAYDPRYNAAEIQVLVSRLGILDTVYLVVYSGGGLIVGGAAGSIIGLAIGNAEVFAVAGLVLGLVAGYVLGYIRVAWSRLEAQLALCQIAIEENTRVSERNLPRVVPLAGDVQQGAVVRPSTALSPAAPLPLYRASDRIAEEHSRAAKPLSTGPRLQRCKNCDAEFPFVDVSCPNCGTHVG
jgi:hypothetical protein